VDGHTKKHTRQQYRERKIIVLENCCAFGVIRGRKGKSLKFLLTASMSMFHIYQFSSFYIRRDMLALWCHVLFTLHQ